MPMMSAKTTTPPTTPPAMAPAGVEDFLDVGAAEFSDVGAPDAEVLLVVEDEPLVCVEFWLVVFDCVMLSAMILCKSVKIQPPTGSVRLAPPSALREISEHHNEEWLSRLTLLRSHLRLSVEQYNWQMDRASFSRYRWRCRGDVAVDTAICTLSHSPASACHCGLSLQQQSSASLYRLRIDDARVRGLGCIRSR